MFWKSFLFVIIMIGIAAGALIALVFPPWILAIILAMLIIAFGITFLFRC